MTYRIIIERISPLWLGIGISGSLLITLFVVEASLGRLDLLRVEGEFNVLATVSGGVLRDLRLAVVHCLVIGYLPAALLQVMRSGRKTVMALQGVLDCTGEECEALAASVKLNAYGLVVTGLVGLALSFAGPYLVPPVPLSPWSPSTWSPEVAWQRILNPISLIWSFWLGYAIITVSVRMSRIATKLRQIDFFDFSPLKPFTQQGLTSVLLFIGSVSIWSLMLLETGFAQVMWTIGGLTLIVTALALFSPAYGVHLRIVAAKEEELRWVNLKISALRDSLQDPQAKGRSGAMADLIAYRGLTESIPDWPFTTSTYARLILYALLPMMSWSIGLAAEAIANNMLLQ